MGFPTKNDHFGVFGGIPIFGTSTLVLYLLVFCLWLCGLFYFPMAIDNDKLLHRDWKLPRVAAGVAASVSPLKMT